MLIQDNIEAEILDDISIFDPSITESLFLKIKTILEQNNQANDKLDIIYNKLINDINKLNKFSKVVTQSNKRSAAQSMFYALGLNTEDLKNINKNNTMIFFFKLIF